MALESWDDAGPGGKAGAGVRGGSVNPLWVYGHGTGVWLRGDGTRLGQESKSCRHGKCCCGVCGPRCCPEVLCCSHNKSVRWCCRAVLAMLLLLLPFVAYIAADLLQLLS